VDQRRRGEFARGKAAFPGEELLSEMQNAIMLKVSGLEGELRVAEGP